VMRRLLLLDQPQETRFFLFLGVFGIGLGAIYWFLTYEVAGTVLLAGFGLGTGLLGIGLLRARPRRVAVAAAVGARESAADRDTSATAQATRGEAADLPGGGAAGIDTPFDTPLGRLPGETLAPLALGLGIALAITAVVFGPWLLVAGLLPMAWGAWTWLSAARDELAATGQRPRGRRP
jgi:hypothetical protein